MQRKQTAIQSLYSYYSFLTGWSIWFFFKLSFGSTYSTLDALKLCAYPMFKSLINLGQLSQHAVAFLNAIQ